MTMLLAVTAAGADRIVPTGGAGGRIVRERLTVGGWISMSHLSAVKIGGEAGDFKPPFPVFASALRLHLLSGCLHNFCATLRQ